MQTLLVVAVLAAGGLDDAKAALAKLDAGKPVHGVLKVMRWQRASGGKKPIESSAGATFQVDDSASGVSMHCSAGMLNEKSATLVATTTLARVHRLLDARSDVAEKLEHADAELLTEEASTWKDRPARLLKLKLSGDGIKELDGAISVQQARESASLWVGEDGTVLASEVAGDLEAGVMMIKVKNHSRVQREYTVANGRLIVFRESEETDSDGMGHTMQIRQTTELQVDNE